MPEINVSEELYRQIEAEAADGNLDRTLARMVHSYQRGNTPSE